MMDFAEKIKEFIGFEVWSDLDHLLIYRGENSFYIKVGEFGVALLQRWIDGLDVYIEVSIFYGDIPLDSEWFYKDWIYFIEELRLIIPEFVGGDIFSGSYIYGFYTPIGNGYAEEIRVKYLEAYRE